MAAPEQTQKTDVPTQVFEGFLAALEKEGVAQEIIQRLKKTLIEEAKFTDKHLKAAIFPEEVAP
jgi:hypothetical protein